MVRQVLVIDDEPSILVITKISLEATIHWKVITTTSVSEALALADSEPLDVILLDVVMPELDGITMLHKLRSKPHTKDIPVIFLTARARECERQALERLGVAGVITKPFEPKEIAGQIKTLLHWSA